MTCHILATMRKYKVGDNVLVKLSTMALTVASTILRRSSPSGFSPERDDISHFAGVTPPSDVPRTSAKVFRNLPGIKRARHFCGMTRRQRASTCRITRGRLPVRIGGRSNANPAEVPCRTKGGTHPLTTILLDYCLILRSGLSPLAMICRAEV